MCCETRHWHRAKTNSSEKKNTHRGNINPRKGRLRINSGYFEEIFSWIRRRLENFRILDFNHHSGCNLIWILSLSTRSSGIIFIIEDFFFSIFFFLRFFHTVYTSIFLHIISCTEYNSPYGIRILLMMWILPLLLFFST